MIVYIENTDKERTVLVTGLGEETPSLAILGEKFKRASQRYVLRPNEKKTFNIELGEMLGIEEL